MRQEETRGQGDGGGRREEDFILVNCVRYADCWNMKLLTFFCVFRTRELHGT